MTTQEILNQNTTKTEKIKALLALGLTRSQTAELLGVGYGFVQNVYARVYGTTRSNNRNTVFFLTRKFGIELEMYGVNRNEAATEISSRGVNCQNERYNHMTRRHWKTIHDSSINGDEGCELVSPPLQGAKGLKQVEKVCDALTAINAKVNKSCGFHAHFDASDLSLDDWKRLLLNYAACEELFDSMMPKSRRANNNGYCKSVKFLRTQREEIMNAETMDVLRSIMGNSRYWKLNIESFWRHKTVEFRQHSGTIEFSKISQWLTIANRLIEVSRTKELTNAEEFLADLPTTTQAYIAERKERLAA